MPPIGTRITAVAHECKPFAIGDEIAGEPDWADESAVRRSFVVEAKPLSLVPDRVNAFGQFAPVIAAGGALRPTPIGIEGRRRGIFRKNVQYIRQHKFLMLLLVMKADFHQRRHAAKSRGRGAA